MPTIKISDSANVQLLPFIKWLISHRVMSLRDGADLLREIREGRDGSFEISSELISGAADELNYMGCKFEVRC